MWLRAANGCPAVGRPVGVYGRKTAAFRVFCGGGGSPSTNNRPGRMLDRRSAAPRITVIETPIGGVFAKGLPQAAPSAESRHVEGHTVLHAPVRPNIYVSFPACGTGLFGKLDFDAATTGRHCKLIRTHGVGHGRLSRRSRAARAALPFALVIAACKGRSARYGKPDAAPRCLGDVARSVDERLSMPIKKRSSFWSKGSSTLRSANLRNRPADRSTPSVAYSICRDW